MLPPVEEAERLLALGKSFRARSLFDEAERNLKTAFRTSESLENRLLKAHVAAELSWLNYEQARYNSAWQWTQLCDRAIGAETGYSFQKLFESLKFGTHSTLLSGNGAVAQAMNLALHIRRKVLVELVAYRGQLDLSRKACDALADGFTLARYLGMPRQVAHDKMWQAILLARSEKILDRVARRCLEEARDTFNQFSDAELGRAYLLRARGVLYWQASNHAPARRCLLEPADRLCSLGDGRALGPTYFVLSKVEIQGDGGSSYENALRYGLAGAAVHPYGFVADNVRELLHERDARDLVGFIKRDLMSGRGEPFATVQRILGILLRGTGRTVIDVIAENLRKVNRLLPSVA